LKTELWVTSADGTILLGPKLVKPALTPQQLADTAEGATIGSVDPSPTGNDLVAIVGTRGLRSYDGLGWRVVARRPVTAALTRTNGTILVIFLIGTIAALASSLAAALIAGRVTRPLSMLADNADKIGRDPNIGLIHRQSGSLDIVRLTNSLRSLVRRIDFAEAHLSAAKLEVDRSEEAIAELRTLANTDPMTGLLNRRGFREFATKVGVFAGHERRELGVLMIDIDHFKRINDVYGHAAGDRVIVEIARLLAGSLRASDRIARFGGEEFVVSLRDVDEAVIGTWAERIRQQIEEAVIVSEGQSLKVTVSIGATAMMPDDREIEDVIHRADLALYDA
ncbi:MAG: GGDEF domain-containing protein, partial [Sphingomonas sp.]